MVAEEVLITLSGGAPWGFRLQGGVDHQKPLQVAKVRKRSKACRAGLKETDELVSINDQPCDELSHAQAMILIDASQGILHIRVKRVPAGFQSVVLVTRAPSPRIDKEYRASLQTLSPTDLHQAPVREVHRSRSSLTSGLTSPPGSEAYYGETDSDADVAGYERQRRQKRRSPNSNTGKPTGRTSPEGGETSEMSGYDSAPEAQAYPNLSKGHGGGETGGLPGVARREVIYQPPAPGLWSSQTSTETSSIISSADDQGPRDGEQEYFLELANVPLVSPERAKEAMMLRSRNQLVPMVGPVNNPVDEELTTTYMEKAKQAKLNRGDTPQDKHVKEARSKCRTIASLLTAAPNPHSKGVLMFKKRRQRSKKYTLTSFGSVDEDQCLDSQEEDGVLHGSDSEFEEEGFSAAPDPTWDSDYLDMLEKRATAGVEGRGDGEEDAPSPGLDATTGKGAQLFEQQRKRAAEHAKKAEAIQSQAAQQAINEQAQMFYPDSQGYTPMQQDVYQVQPSFNMSNVDLSQATGGTAKMGMQGGPRPAIDSVYMITGNTPLAETSRPEAPASNVLNRTARPFTPGFITIRAATAPVAFNPSATKTNQRPTSAAAVPPPFSTVPEQAINATSVMLQLSPGPASSSKAFAPVTHTAGASVILNPLTSSSFVETHTAQQMTAAYPVQYVNVPPVPPAPPQPMFSAPSQTIVSASPHVVSGPPQHILSATPQFKASAPIPPISQIPGSIQRVALCPPVVPVAPPCPTQIPMTPVATVSMVSEPEAIAATPVSGQGGRSGILLESRRRGGKQKPMFNVPEVKKNSPNPELLSMVHNFDERATNPKHSQPFSEDFYDAAQETSSTVIGIGKMPPPVAPKPRVLQEAPQIIQAGGKGAELFVRRQNRMGMYVMDAPPPTHYQDEVPLHGTAQPLHTSSIPSSSSQWKYSPNVRAPPPIGYNPLLAPSFPTGHQRNMSKPGSKSRGGSQREGIQALDFMRRQPYQLNSAMFNYSGSAAHLSASPSHHETRHGHQTAMVGSSLTSPKQIPVKTARAYEIKRFSTPTPMSAPTLVPKVLVPRSATTLGERIDDSDMTTPPPSLTDPTSDVKLARAPFRESVSLSSQIGGLPSLPKLSAMPPPNLVPGVAAHCIPVSYNTGLQAAKQFQSAPELSILSSLPPLKSNPVQAPKPRFVANKGGVQAHVWRPGAI